MRIHSGHVLVVLIGLSACRSEPDAPSSSAALQQPNILLIYADDVGYGDFSCYGMTATATPNVDRLAREGLRFTDAYASSATCTPSRYSLLTGEYAFRKPGTGVLRGDAAMIIEAGRSTLASTLQASGYRTAVIGKWHLGLGDGAQPIDWNRPIAPGPNQVGFDESFLMAATGDRVPCVYLRDGLVVGLDADDPIEVSYEQPFEGLPTGVSERDSLRMDWSHGHNQAVVDHVGRIGYMRGGKRALWVDEDMADRFTHEAVAFLEANRERPFFLFFATHDVHVPRLPNERFGGASGMGPRGDALLEFDDNVGTLLAALDRLGLAENTLVILTSDNGPVLDDGYVDQANELLGSHRPSGPLRAGKYSLYEGGTRVPWIVRWPARVRAGTSSAVLSQVDLPATLAALAGARFDSAQGPDSQDQLAALLGDSPTGRESVVLHARGKALRAGDWKFVPPGRVTDGLGPWTAVQVAEPGQLFDLSADLGEQRDLAADHPEQLARMQQLLSLVSGSNSH